MGKPITHAPWRIWETTGAEETAESVGGVAVRKFEGPLELFRMPEAVARFAVGRVWDDGDDWDGYETTRAQLLRDEGGMAEMRLELAVDGLLAESGEIQELPALEGEYTPGDVGRRVRYFVGPVALIEDEDWMRPGSEVEDMPGYRVERKAPRRLSLTRAQATITLANTVADSADATGVGVGQVEVDWYSGQEPIYRHPEFAALTYDELVAVYDWVNGDRTNWETVEDEGGDSDTVLAQKKLARLLAAGHSQLTFHRPVVRQTIDLPDPPPTLDWGAGSLLEGYDAGQIDTPPVRVLRPAGEEYFWVKTADKVTRADTGRWTRIREWTGHVRMPVLEGESIVEADL